MLIAPLQPQPGDARVFDDPVVKDTTWWVFTHVIGIPLLAAATALMAFAALMVWVRPYDAPRRAGLTSAAGARGPHASWRGGLLAVQTRFEPWVGGGASTSPAGLCACG